MRRAVTAGAASVASAEETPHNRSVPWTAALCWASSAWARLPLEPERVGVPEHDVGGGCQPHAPALRTQQFHLEITGQQTQLLGDGRGGQVQHGSGGGHCPVLGECPQDVQPVVNHKAEPKRLPPKTFAGRGHLRASSLKP